MVSGDLQSPDIRLFGGLFRLQGRLFGIGNMIRSVVFFEIRDGADLPQLILQFVQPVFQAAALFGFNTHLSPE